MTCEPGPLRKLLFICPARAACSIHKVWAIKDLLGVYVYLHILIIKLLLELLSNIRLVTHVVSSNGNFDR